MTEDQEQSEAVLARDRELVMQWEQIQAQFSLFAAYLTEFQQQRLTKGLLNMEAAEPGSAEDREARMLCHSARTILEFRESLEVKAVNVENADAELDSVRPVDLNNIRG